MRHFRETTENNVVIMGRKTWDSLPIKPLKNRVNIVLSKTLKTIPNCDDVIVFDDFEKAVLYSSEKCYDKRIFIIGGEQIYKLAIGSARCVELLVTHINQNHGCTEFFPLIDTNEWNVSETLMKTEAFRIIRYRRN